MEVHNSLRDLVHTYFTIHLIITFKNLLPNHKLNTSGGEDSFPICITRPSVVLGRTIPEGSRILYRGSLLLAWRDEAPLAPQETLIESGELD